MRIVYVSHNGIGTPLVRSQVLPYLRLLAERGHEIDLVTFERGDPFPDSEFPRARWHPVRARRGGSLFAKVSDVLRGAVMVAAVARRRRAEALHARSYLPAAICWCVGRLLRLPYVFDMRGFMGEEFVDAGTWQQDELRHRAVRHAERYLLRGAAEIVVLTHAAERRLRTDAEYGGHVAPRRITVIPCAVDLDLFRPSTRADTPPTLVYSGSLGTWYLLEEMIAVYARARDHRPDLCFLFLNRGEHALIRGAWAGAGLPEACLEIRDVDPLDVPAQLSRARVAIALLKRAPSKIGSSPIKVAEYLACGLPVIVNEGLGDSDELVQASGAGHVIGAYDEVSLSAAAAAMVSLVDDVDARRRARELAERVFDVRAAAEAYDRVYSRLAT